VPAADRPGFAPVTSHPVKGSYDLTPKPIGPPIHTTKLKFLIFKNKSSTHRVLQIAFNIFVFII